MAQLQKGRKEALGELIRRYERELYGYLRRLTGDPTLAEDIFQNTFLQVFQRADQYTKAVPHYFNPCRALGRNPSKLWKKRNGPSLSNKLCFNCQNLCEPSCFWHTFAA
jgi:hypothetical protein